MELNGRLDAYNPSTDLEKYKLKIVANDKGDGFKLRPIPESENPGSKWGPTAIELFDQLVFEEKVANNENTYAIPEYLASKNVVHVKDTSFYLIRAEIHVLSSKEGDIGPDLMEDIFYWAGKNIDGQLDAPIFKSRYWWRG